MKGNYYFPALHTGLFMDIDLKCYISDYVGCDSLLNLGYAYKTTVNSCSYITYPSAPFCGVKYLETPLDASGQQAGMSSFCYYSNDFSVTGNPKNAQEYFQYLQNTWTNGTPFTHGGTGYGGTDPVTYVFPDPPNDSTGWSDCTAGNMEFDKRLIMNSGPFAFAPGDTLKFEFVVIYTECIIDTSFLCPDISCLTNLADQIQNMYDSGQVGRNYSNVNSQIKQAGTVFTLFPNPSTGRFFLQFSGKMTPSSSLEIEFTDLSGRTVARQRIEQPRQEIDLSGHRPGLYLYRITENGARLGSGKAVLF